MTRYGSRPEETRIPDGLLSDMTKPLASYDGGGDVPEDQVAVVHEGERVLSPEEAEKYRAEHGAPADFSGRVLPNPNGIKPMLDTEAKPRVDEPMGGAKMQTDNAPLSRAPMNTQIPPANNKELDETFPTAMVTESSNKFVAPPKEKG